MNRTRFQEFLASIYVIAEFDTPPTFDIICLETMNLIPKTFTDDEIIYCFRSGVLKEWGDYQRLSIPTFNDWIKAYRKSPEREKNLSNRPLLCSENQLTDEEKEQKTKKYIIDAFNEFKLTGKINDCGNSIYNFLERYEILLLSAELKWKYYNEAKQRQKVKYEMKFLESRDQKFKKLLEQIERSSIDDMVAAEAKRIAVVEYFNGLIKMDENIEEIINKKQ